MNNKFSPIINSLIKVARNSQDKTIRDYNEISYLQSSFKGSYKFASFTLENIAKSVYYGLNKIREDYGIVVVDCNNEILFHKQANSEYYFIAKILDGFINFAHHINDFATAIAVCKKDAENGNYQIIAEIIDNFGNLIYTEKGSGCFSDNYPAKVSTRKNLNESIAHFSSFKILNDNYDAVKEIASRCNVRISNSLVNDCFMLSTGRIDLLFIDKMDKEIIANKNNQNYIENDKEIEKLLVLVGYIGFLTIKEARGMIYDISGNEIDLVKNNINHDNIIIATNGNLDKEIIKFISNK